MQCAFFPLDGIYAKSVKCSASESYDVFTEAQLTICGTVA